MRHGTAHPRFPQQDSDLALAAGRSLDNRALVCTSHLAADLLRHSPYTGEHSGRVQYTAMTFSTYLGLSPFATLAIGEAASIHDIGKMGISPALLEKGNATQEEIAKIFTHARLGEQIIRAQADLPAAFRDFAADTVLFHHRRVDNSGYPKELDGQRISYSSQIIALADSFDAMTQKRPYSEPMTKPHALDELMKHKGFYPKLREAFVMMMSAPLMPLPSLTLPLGLARVDGPSTTFQNRL